MTFLFDIGRVLLDFQFEPSLSKLLPPDVADPVERLALLLERKDEFEAGKIGADAYINWALEILGSNATPEEFRHHWRHIFTPNEPMWRKVRELNAAGHRLILFSNINEIHTPWIFETYPEFSLFHGAVLSHETGYIKPQREIYQHAIDQYGITPEATLYVDDMPENIATGRAMGFQAWQYDLREHTAFEVWVERKLAALPDA